MKWKQVLKERPEEVGWELHGDGGVMHESQAAPSAQAGKWTWVLNPSITLRVRAFPPRPHKRGQDALWSFKSEQTRAGFDLQNVTAPHVGRLDWGCYNHKKKRRNPTKRLIKTLGTDVHSCSCLTFGIFFFFFSFKSARGKTATSVKLWCKFPPSWQTN